MIIGFTICSNNYLAHAKTLGDSFLHYHPEARFVIGLVDKQTDDFDFDFFSSFDIITVDKLKMIEFEELHAKYNITELNTSVKPAYIHYLFNDYGADKIIYIDPDILVTSRFEEVLQLLDNNNIILTPHIFTPIDDEFVPTDYDTLKGGVFNLGFIALSNYPKLVGFLNWWHERVVKYGFSNFHESMFYDQIWINYVPTMFDNYYILKHPGYNVANWNLHERYLKTLSEDGYLVNNQYPLRFFHFSNYKYKVPDRICTYHTRFTFQSRPDLQDVFNDYHNRLLKNRVEEISKLTVYYYPFLGKPNPSEQKLSLLAKISNRAKLTARVLLTGNINK